MGLKLRLLKNLLESQFDYNNKLKAAVNLLTAEELRSKPIGTDLAGNIYWVHLDPSANLKVFCESVGSGEWSIAATDRPSLVKLLHKLTGDDSQDYSPVLEPIQPATDVLPSSSSSSQGDENGALSEGTTENDDDENETTNNKLNANSGVSKTEVAFECSEAIEEDVMHVSGPGNGVECDTGNPDREEPVSTSSTSHVSTSSVNPSSTFVVPDSRTDDEALAIPHFNMEVDSTTAVSEGPGDEATSSGIVDSVEGEVSTSIGDTENEVGSSGLVNSQSSESDAAGAFEESRNDFHRVWSISEICASSASTSGDNFPDCNVLDEHVGSSSAPSISSSNTPCNPSNSDRPSSLALPSIIITPTTPERFNAPSSPVPEIMEAECSGSDFNLASFEASQPRIDASLPESSSSVERPSYHNIDQVEEGELVSGSIDCQVPVADRPAAIDSIADCPAADRLAAIDSNADCSAASAPVSDRLAAIDPAADCPAASVPVADRLAAIDPVGECTSLSQRDKSASSSGQDEEQSTSLQPAPSIIDQNSDRDSILTGPNSSEKSEDETVIDSGDSVNDGNPHLDEKVKPVCSKSAKVDKNMSDVEKENTAGCMDGEGTSHVRQKVAESPSDSIPVLVGNSEVIKASGGEEPTTLLETDSIQTSEKQIDLELNPEVDSPEEKNQTEAEKVVDKTCENSEVDQKVMSENLLSPKNDVKKTEMGLNDTEARAEKTELDAIVLPKEAEDTGLKEKVVEVTSAQLLEDSSMAIKSEHEESHIITKDTTNVANNEGPLSDKGREILSKSNASESNVQEKVGSIVKSEDEDPMEVDSAVDQKLSNDFIIDSKDDSSDPVVAEELKNVEGAPHATENFKEKCSDIQNDSKDNTSEPMSTEELKNSEEAPPATEKSSNIKNESQDETPEPMVAEKLKNVDQTPPATEKPSDSKDHSSGPVAAELSNNSDDAEPAPESSQDNTKTTRNCPKTKNTKVKPKAKGKGPARRSSRRGDAVPSEKKEDMAGTEEADPLADTSAPVQSTDEDPLAVSEPQLGELLFILPLTYIFVS